MQVSIEPVQSEYVRQLVRARPALEDQLADIYQVLAAARQRHTLCDETPLDSARAAYIAYLHDSQLTFNQLVAEIAALCACVFVQQRLPDFAHTH
jgi:hypothetical protein